MVVADMIGFNTVSGVSSIINKMSNQQQAYELKLFDKLRNIEKES